MTRWETMGQNVAPGESVHREIKPALAEGWEPFAIERDDRGWRTVYFKRPDPSQMARKQ